MERMTKSVAVLAVLAVVCLVGAAAQASIMFEDKGVTNNWTNGSTWESGSSPVAGDWIVVDGVGSGGSATVIKTASSVRYFGDSTGANASTWSAGIIWVDARKQVEHVAGSTLNITGSARLAQDWNESDVLGGMYNYGTVNINTTATFTIGGDGSNLTRGGADFWNTSTGVLDFLQNGNIKFYSRRETTNVRPKDFINAGILRKGTTTGTVNIEADNDPGTTTNNENGFEDYFTNTGTIDVRGGTLAIRYFNGTGDTVDDNISVAGAFQFGVDGPSNGLLNMAQELVFTNNITLSLYDNLAGGGIMPGHEYLVATYNAATKGAFNFVTGTNVVSFREAAGGNGTNLYVTAVPEPATLGLLALGGVGMLLRRKRA